MNSGSVINVRLSGEKTASLQEIKTGVTLRVTPRLIPNPGDNRSQDQILLKVYAETSSPMAESMSTGFRRSIASMPVRKSRFFRASLIWSVD